MPYFRLWALLLLHKSLTKQRCLFQALKLQDLPRKTHQLPYISHFWSFCLLVGHSFSLKVITPQLQCKVSMRLTICASREMFLILVTTLLYSFCLSIVCPHHPYIVSTDSQILPWVHEKFIVKLTMSNVDGCTFYMRIGCPNCSEKLDAGGNKITINNSFGRA